MALRNLYEACKLLTPRFSKYRSQYVCVPVLNVSLPKISLYQLHAAPNTRWQCSRTAQPLSLRQCNKALLQARSHLIGNVAALHDASGLYSWAVKQLSLADAKPLLSSAIPSRSVHTINVTSRRQMNDRTTDGGSRRRREHYHAHRSDRRPRWSLQRPGFAMAERAP